MFVAIILWIILGLAAGWLASILTHSPHSLGVDLILGVIGALVGGLIANFLGLPGITGFNFWSLLVAVVGAVLLIVIGNLLS